MCIYKRASCPGCSKELKGHHTFEKCVAPVCQGEKTVAIKLRLRDITLTRAGHQWQCPHAGCIFNPATEELLTDWEAAQSDPQSDLGPKVDALFTGPTPIIRDLQKESRPAGSNEGSAITQVQPAVRSDAAMPGQALVEQSILRMEAVQQGQRQQPPRQPTPIQQASPPQTSSQQTSSQQTCSQQTPQPDHKPLQHAPREHLPVQQASGHGTLTPASQPSSSSGSSQASSGRLPGALAASGNGVSKPEPNPTMPQKRKVSKNPKPPQRWKAEELARLKDLYDQGVPYSQMVKHFPGRVCTAKDLAAKVVHIGWTKQGTDLKSNRAKHEGRKQGGSGSSSG